MVHSITKSTVCGRRSPRSTTRVWPCGVGLPQMRGIADLLHDWDDPLRPLLEVTHHAASLHLRRRGRSLSPHRRSSRVALPLFLPRLLQSMSSIVPFPFTSFIASSNAGAREEPQPSQQETPVQAEPSSSVLQPLSPPNGSCPNLLEYNFAIISDALVSTSSLSPDSAPL